jgi:RHS repeat-associated protein
VAGITNNINPARSQSFTYDQLNRISTAKTQATTEQYAWGLNFGYDAWANLLSASVSQGSAYTLGVSMDPTHPTNRLFGYSYDASGNMLNDGTNNYIFNAESEMTTAAGVTYTYDGDGNRVRKATTGTPPALPTPYKLYWTGGGSDPLDETDANGNLTDEYIFFGGKRIARRDPANNVDYYFADHLGTARVVTNASGTIQDDSDFYPFGGERSYLSSSGNTYKFTGKERDGESGLDNFGARYYGSSMGRFTSPDPVMIMRQKMFDPQQWNMYSYVRNNPLRMVDTNGKWPTDIHNQIIDKAFPGLSKSQRAVLKSASYAMDHCITCQSEGNAYQHFMRAPNQNPADAKQKTQDWIHVEEHLAQTIQKTMPTSTSEIKDNSLSMFGNAAHTVGDGTSPAHVDAQGNPLPWNPYSPSAVEAHEAAESTISPEQMNNAVAAVQQAFKDTYGQAATQQAATPPPPPPPCTADKDKKC